MRPFSLHQLQNVACMSQVVTLNHGRYVIKAGPVAGQWKARAFLSGAKQGSGIVAEATGSSQEAVVESLRQQLEEKDRAFLKSRRYDEVTKFHVPSSGEYEIALAITSFHASQRAMLKAHAEAGRRGMTATELARAGGYSDFSSANMHYGKAGRLLAESLGVEVPPSSSRDDLPTAVLATWIETPGEENIGLWIMYPELVEALKKLP